MEVANSEDGNYYKHPVHYRIEGRGGIVDWQSYVAPIETTIRHEVSRGGQAALETANEEECREESRVYQSADTNGPDLPRMAHHTQNEGGKSPFEYDLPCDVQLKAGHEVLILC